MTAAITTLEDVKVSNAQINAGMWEAGSTNVEAFNAASAGSIILTQAAKPGEYEMEAFWTAAEDLVHERDPDGVAAVDDQQIVQANLVEIKVNRRVGPAHIKLDALRKSGLTSDAFSFGLGQRIAYLKTKDYISTAILAAAAALSGQSDVVYNATGVSGGNSISQDVLARGLAKFGDAMNDIVCWVMHSATFADLMRNDIAAGVTNVADRVIYGGTPGTLGKPVIISDLAALYNDVSGATDTYEVLGLTRNAVKVTESENTDVIAQVVLGTENIGLRYQAEYAFNLGLRGMAYDISNSGTTHPGDTALAVATNWDKVCASHKGLPGVRILVNPRA